jgi:hypothetical protein
MASMTSRLFVPTGTCARGGPPGALVTALNVATPSRIGLATERQRPSGAVDHPADRRGRRQSEVLRKVGGSMLVRPSGQHTRIANRVEPAAEGEGINHWRPTDRHRRLAVRDACRLEERESGRCGPVILAVWATRRLNGRASG